MRHAQYECYYRVDTAKLLVLAQAERAWRSLNLPKEDRKLPFHPISSVSVL